MFKDAEEAPKDVKNFRQNLLTELKPNFEIFAEDTKAYKNSPRCSDKSRSVSRISQGAFCPTCSQPTSPQLNVSKMDVDPSPQRKQEGQNPENGWTMVGKSRKRGKAREGGTPNTSPEAKRVHVASPVPVPVSPGRFGRLEDVEMEEEEPMETETATPLVNTSKPQDLMAMRISSPEPRKGQGKKAKKNGKGAKGSQNGPKKLPTEKSQPKGEPAKLIEKVRTWFDQQMIMYEKEGSNIQTLTWIADSLTAAIFKANNGNTYLVEKIIKRYPPPLVKEGEMSTQTSRKENSAKPRHNRTAQENNESLRVQYAKDRVKTFHKIIGKQSAKCTIDIDTVESHFKKTLKAQPVSDSALDTVCSGIKKAKMDPRIEEAISSTEVKAILAKIKDTSPGTDGVKYSDLRWFDPDGNRLAMLFDECRKHRKIPSHWKEAETVLLPKDCTEEERKKPENWRPISLMATIYKLYSSVWSRRISSVPGVISPCQRGFQTTDGCNESIGILRTCIDTATVLNRNLSCSWLDLTNAFGSVPHELIRKSLRAFGYSEQVTSIVDDMYDGSSMRIKTAEQKTQSIRIEAGVKQGDPISPTLFNICLEGIIRRHQMRKTGYSCVSNDVRCLAFADDLAILTNNKDEMQQVINQLDEDCRSVALIFKPKKCASLTIDQGKVDQYAKIKINGQAIRTMSQDDSYKYLGVKTGSGGRASESESLVQITKELQQVHATDLAPNQKLDVLKAFLLPRLQHLYRNATPKLSELREFENVVMKSVKMYHNIPIRGSPLEYVQIPVKNGGLGVMSPRYTCLITFLASTLSKLWSDDEYISSIHRNALNRITVKVMGLETQKATIQEQCEYLNTTRAVKKGGFNIFSRMNEAIRTLSVIQGAPLKSMRFIPDNGEIALSVQATEKSQCKVFSKVESHKLVTKLKDLVRSAMLKTFLEVKKVKSKVVEVIQHHPPSNKFVRDGKKCSISAQKFVHRARLNLLACNGNNYSKELPRGCRRCNHDFESQMHILQNCRYSMASGITLRHDRVMNRILEEIGKGKKAHYKILVDMEVGPTRERPDIIMEQRGGPEVLLADVTVPFENGVEAVKNAWARKIEKYQHFVNYFRKLGKRAVILPLVVGSLGTYWPETSQSLKLLGLSDGQIRNVIPDISQIALESSKNIYWRHIFGDNYKIVNELFCNPDEKKVDFSDGKSTKASISKRFLKLKSQRANSKKSKEDQVSRANARNGPNWRRPEPKKNSNSDDENRKEKKVHKMKSFEPRRPNSKHTLELANC